MTKIVIIVALLFADVSVLASNSTGTPATNCAVQLIKDAPRDFLNPPSHSHLSYRSRVILEVNGDVGDAAKNLKEMLYSWMQSRFQDFRQVNRSIFDDNAFIDSNGSQMAVRNFGSASTGLNYWGLIVEKTDQTLQRRWRTDFTLTINSKTKKMILHTRVLTWTLTPHADQDFDYAIPRIVRDIFEAKSKWRASFGDLYLPPGKAVDLKAEDVSLFRKVLASTNRLPVIYVSIDHRTGSRLVDVDAMAYDLTGLAIVAKEDDMSTQMALRTQMPESHRVWGGGVRIYLPGVDIQTPSDSYRHRYFSGENILQTSPEMNRQRIITGLLAWQEQNRRDEVTTMSDIMNLEIHEIATEIRTQFEQHQKSNDSNMLNELLEIYDAEAKQLKKKNEVLEKELFESQQQLEVTAQAYQDLTKQIAALEAAIASPNRAQKTEKMYVEPKNYVTRAFVGEQLPSTLPKSLSDVVAIMADSFKGKLVFTDKAVSSAKDATSNNVDKGWEMLFEMATTLYDLYFNESMTNAQISEQFLERSGYEMTGRESATVRNTARMARLREDVYDGRTINIEPHVKWGNRAPKMIRIHFYVDRVKKVIVIGHVGDHLENGATRYQ